MTQGVRRQTAAAHWSDSLLARELELSRKRAVLVSAPGLVQRATASVLASCEELEVVAIPPGALSATRVLSAVQPDFLLIDATVAEEEIEELLGWVEVNCPGVQCVIMTVTSHQAAQALAWGADLAIHRAALASQLKEVLNCIPTS